MGTVTRDYFVGKAGNTVLWESVEKTRHAKEKHMVLQGCTFFGGKTTDITVFPQ